MNGPMLVEEGGTQHDDAVLRVPPRPAVPVRVVGQQHLQRLAVEGIDNGVEVVRHRHLKPLHLFGVCEEARERHCRLPPPQIALKCAVRVARVEAKVARLDNLSVAVHEDEVGVVPRTLKRRLQQLVAPSVPGGFRAIQERAPLVGSARVVEAECT